MIASTKTEKGTDSTCIVQVFVDNNDDTNDNGNNQNHSTDCTNHWLVRNLQNFIKPVKLDELLYPDLEVFTNKRVELDQIIIDWTHDEILQSEPLLLQQPLLYQNMKGKWYTKEYGSLVLHFFNHQTHHRGQVTTLLSQIGMDVGVTDLLELIPNIELDDEEM